jgi:hypothetical protein
MHEVIKGMVSLAEERELKMVRHPAEKIVVENNHHGS